VDVRLRPPRADEADAVAATINRHSQRTYGADSITPEQVAHWFTIPDIDVERDMVLVERDGEIVGYADVSDGGTTKTRFWIDLRLLPDCGPEAGDAVVARLEERARERAAPGALTRGAFAEPDEFARQVLAARGYELVRHSLQMIRSLTELPDAPEWPDGIQLRTADPDDLMPVFGAVEEGFADHWEHEPDRFEDFTHFLHGPDHDPSLWYVAYDGGEIAGVCLCSPYEWGQKTTGHVNSLSVRPRWRRRGLALAFLLHAFREFRSRGREHVSLGVDAENTTGAVRLYQRAGMHIERRFDLWDRPVDS
jgi:mycothiol synthase